MDPKSGGGSGGGGDGGTGGENSEYNSLLCAAYENYTTMVHNIALENSHEELSDADKEKLRELEKNLEELLPGFNTSLDQNLDPETVKAGIRKLFTGDEVYIKDSNITPLMCNYYRQFLELMKLVFENRALKKSYKELQRISDAKIRELEQKLEDYSGAQLKVPEGNVMKAREEATEGNVMKKARKREGGREAAKNSSKAGQKSLRSYDLRSRTRHNNTNS